MISQYAVINNAGLVVNLVQWDGVSSWVQPVGHTLVKSSTAKMGDTYASGVFTSPSLPAPSPMTAHQEAEATLASGINLTSESTSELNGRYSVNTASIANINAIETFIMKNNAFPGELSELPWLDFHGDMHTFTSTDLFSEFATAVANYVTLVVLYRDSNGELGSLPSADITIS